MKLRNLFFSGRRAPHRQPHKRSFIIETPVFQTEQEMDPLSKAVNDLKIEEFKEKISVFKLENKNPASLSTNNKPILIDLCSKILNTYKTEPAAFRAYKAMLLSLQADLLPEHYQQDYEGETALTLLVQVDDRSIEWHLNKILSSKEMKDKNTTVPGIDGTTDLSSANYGKDIPLIRAAQAQSYHGVAALLRHGATPDIKDLMKKTPLDYAMSHSDPNPQLIALLKECCDPTPPKLVYTY